MLSPVCCTAVQQRLAQQGVGNGGGGHLGQSIGTIQEETCVFTELNFITFPMFLLQVELECAILKYISNTIFDAVLVLLCRGLATVGGHLRQLIGATGNNS